jgi:hypothetical protein
MANGLATVENPPTDLYRHWIQVQGPVDKQYKQLIQHQEREAKKDTFSTYMAFQERMLEMRMQETMTDSMERLTQRSQPSYQPYQPTYRPTYQPTYRPTYQPTYRPTYQPTYRPTY